MSAIEKCAIYLLMVFMILSNSIDNLEAQKETFNNTSVAIKCEECSQNCILSNAIDTCGCNAGYVLDPDNKSCNAEIPVEIVYANGGNFEIFSLHDNRTITIINDHSYISAYDFSYKEKSLFWASYHAPIYKCKIDEGFEKTEVVVKFGSYIGVIAYDWVYDHLYWVDNVREKLYVANVDGNHMLTIFSPKTLDISSMAIDPNEGWIFWANIKHDGRIESSHLDGTAHHVIASHNVSHPYSLTLDLVKKRVYWVDTKLFTISYCDYNGMNHNVLIKLRRTTQALSITTFEDWIYWSQPDDKIFKTYKTVKSVMKSSEIILGNASENVVSMIKAYHPYRQPNGINHCANNPCAHLCFPNHPIGSSISYICKCSIGYKLQPDGKTCLNRRGNLPDVAISIIGAIISVIILILLFIYRHLLFERSYIGNFKYRREINDEEDVCQNEESAQMTY